MVQLRNIKYSFHVLKSLKMKLTSLSPECMEFTPRLLSIVPVYQLHVIDNFLQLFVLEKNAKSYQ